MAFHYKDPRDERHTNNKRKLYKIRVFLRNNCALTATEDRTTRHVFATGSFFFGIHELVGDSNDAKRSRLSSASDYSNERVCERPLMNLAFKLFPFD